MEWQLFLFEAVPVGIAYFVSFFPSQKSCHGCLVVIAMPFVVAIWSSLKLHFFPFLPFTTSPLTQRWIFTFGYVLLSRIRAKDFGQRSSLHLI
jgi:hypothetical protein